MRFIRLGERFINVNSIAYLEVGNTRDTTVMKFVGGFSSIYRIPIEKLLYDIFCAPSCWDDYHFDNEETENKEKGDSTILLLTPDS